MCDLFTVLYGLSYMSFTRFIDLLIILFRINLIALTLSDMLNYVCKLYSGKFHPIIMQVTWINFGGFLTVRPWHGWHTLDYVYCMPYILH